MKTLFALLLLASSAHAQTWQCVQTGTAVACAPGSPNCTCTQVEAPATPVCPAGSYWNGYTCAMLPYVGPPVGIWPHGEHH